MGEAALRVLAEKRQVAGLQDSGDESGEVGGLFLAEA